MNTNSNKMNDKKNDAAGLAITSINGKRKRQKKKQPQKNKA